MAPQRCRGPPAGRWASTAAQRRLAARALATTNSAEMPTEHAIRSTAGVEWCETCGAYAFQRARLMAQPCPGPILSWAGGGRQQQLRRLRRGRHPHTGRPLVEDGTADVRSEAPAIPVLPPILLAVIADAAFGLVPAPESVPAPPLLDTLAPSERAGHVEAAARPHRILGPRVEAIRQRLISNLGERARSRSRSRSAHAEAAGQPLGPRVEAIRQRLRQRQLPHDGG